MTADHERYEAKMHVVCESVEMHIEEEESKILPRLDAALDADDRRVLAESMLKMKQIAPNYPHPSAPDTPPASVLTGLLAKLTDSGKDVVRRITSADKAAGHRRVAQRARAASGKLRTARGKTRRKARARKPRGR